MHHVLNDDTGWAYYAERFHPGCLAETSLPFGSDQFDCVVMNLETSEIGGSDKSIAIEVCRANTDYVGTTGKEAECLHDLIDKTSVELGRQAAIGDGSPMTTWHTDVENVEQLADAMYAYGGTEHTVCLVQCSAEQFEDVVDELQLHLRKVASR